MTRFVSFATGCLMLTAIAGFVATSQSTALAQTVPPQKGKKETTGGKQMGTAKLTADGAATYPRNKGHKVEKMLDPSGAPILSVLMKDNDGWSFDIRIEFSPDQRTYLLSSRLGKAGAKYTA